MNHPTENDLRAKVFEDREVRGRWRVEKMDSRGGYEEVVMFDGPDARWEAMLHAARTHGAFEVIPLEPYQSQGRSGG
jgi:hypothetical protein